MIYKEITLHDFRTEFYNMNTIKLQLPFAGFYDSYHDNNFDNILEMELYNLEEELGATEEELEEFSNAYYDTDWAKAHQDYVEYYVQRFADWLEDNSKTKFNFTDIEVHSPREYNFVNDSIEASLPSETFNRVYLFVTRFLQRRLKATIEDKFTSRDGFYSYYSNEITVWLDKPIDELDEVERGVIFEVYCEYIHRELAEDGDNLADFLHYYLLGADSNESCAEILYEHSKMYEVYNKIEENHSN